MNAIVCACGRRIEPGHAPRTVVGLMPWRAQVGESRRDEAVGLDPSVLSDGDIVEIAKRIRELERARLPRSEHLLGGDR